MDPRGDKLPASNGMVGKNGTDKKFIGTKAPQRILLLQNYKPVDLFPHIYKWMAENGYTKEQIRPKASISYEISITVLLLLKQLPDGMPDLNS